MLLEVPLSTSVIASWALNELLHLSNNNMKLIGNLQIPDIRVFVSAFE